MATGIAKLQLLIDLKNNLKTGLDGAKKQVEKATGQIQGKLDNFKMNNIKAFDAIKEQVPGVGNAIGMLTNPYVLATVAVLALGTAYYKSVTMANDWQKGMAKINVTAQMSQKELGGLSNKLLEIGQQNVAPIEEIPDAFNQIISAGLDVNTSLKVLEPTLRAAKAGFTDVKTVADAAVGVMNSSGRDINTVYDVLFATMNKGKAEFKDIAQYLPKIIPAARGAGLALEETAGAWAYFTAHGMSAEQATTGAQNMIKALSTSEIAIGSWDKKSRKYDGGLPSIGVKVFDTAGKMRNLKDIAKDLTGVMQGLTDKQKMLTLEQAGIKDTEAKGAILSMIQDYSNFSKTIDFVKNSQGQLNEAYLNSLSPMDNWNQLINFGKGEMIKLGQLALPIINKIAIGIQDTIKWWKDLYANSSLFRDILSGIGTVFEWAFKLGYMNLVRVWNIFQNIGDVIGWVIDKIPGMSGGIEGFYNKVRPLLMYVSQILGQVANIMYKIATFDFKGAYQDFKNFKMPDLNQIKKSISIDNASQKNKDQTNPFTSSQLVEKKTNNNNKVDTSTADAKKISGGSQTKNITVNIDSFIKGFTPQHQSINSMNKDELERWMTEMFLRVVRSAELSL